MATPGSYLTPTNTTSRTPSSTTSPTSNGGMERTGSGGMQPLNQPSTQPAPTMSTQSSYSAPKSPGTTPMDPWQPSFGSTPPPSSPPSNPAGQGGVEKGFFSGGGDAFFKPDSFTADDNPYSKYIADMLPVAQFGQNNYQWRSEFDATQMNNDRNYNRDIYNDSFQQGLSTRQQQAAEWQANTAANQWDRQFGHTQYMDEQGLGLRQQELGLQGQQIGNQFTMGMDQNQATRDVANTYANSNINTAHIAAGADRYGADRQVEGTYAMADAQKHAANMGVNEAHIGAAANRYGAELGLQGALGTADMYSGAQRYGADQQFAGTRYQTDAEKFIASQQNQFLYSQLAQQAQQQQLERENAMRMASMAAYGRSVAPNTQWARSWS